jgi:hypothetical protein
MVMMWWNVATVATVALRFARVGRWIKMSKRRSMWWVSASHDSSSLATVDRCCATAAAKREREREAMKGRGRERSKEGKREIEARKVMSE